MSRYGVCLSGDKYCDGCVLGKAHSCPFRSRPDSPKEPGAVTLRYLRTTINGSVGRENKTKAKSASFMLQSCDLPKLSCGEACTTAVYLLNINGPTHEENKSPLEVSRGKTIKDLKHLRVFGTKCFVHGPKQKCKKWDAKSIPGILVGYHGLRNGYRVYVPKQCPEIEDVYCCLQHNLQNHQPCVAELIKTGRNLCPGTPVYFADSSNEQINSKKILLIPSTTTRLKPECGERIYEIKKPSLLLPNQCGINIHGKIFRIAETLHEDYIKQIKMLANNFKTPNLENIISAGHTWTNTILTILVIIIVVAALVYYKFGWIRKTKQRKNLDTPQKIEEPSFSDLGREEL
ncbi:hypothetical protein ILUMI_13547 [Ignelater luminosus]|uniref:Retroviral polymerase SH3-like domain-containing protein n=1 Tax=Ignelater luminosus TaxID=2038154 RepID=A0A8K0CW10_IGNLU|nr:hypothetical protein ILUMI_13547 [Ignelater luminosus]